MLSTSAALLASRALPDLATHAEVLNSSGRQLRPHIRLCALLSGMQCWLKRSKPAQIIHCRCCLRLQPADKFWRAIAGHPSPARPACSGPAREGSSSSRNMSHRDGEDDDVAGAGPGSMDQDLTLAHQSAEAWDSDSDFQLLKQVGLPAACARPHAACAPRLCVRNGSRKGQPDC